MIKQLPAERPLEEKQRVLEEVLADAADEQPRRRTWLLPVTAAASIAVVAGGAFAVSSLLGSDNSSPTSPTGTKQSGTPTSVTTKPAKDPVQQVDRERLSPAEATAFGTECAKWIGSKDIPGQNFGDAPLDWPGAGARIDKIMHATKVPGRSTKHPTDWSVAVKSGAQIAVCVGQPPTKDSEGHVRRDYEFSILSTRHRDALGSLGGGIAVAGSHSTATMSTDRWVVAPPAAAELQRRIVLNGNPGPLFGSPVVDGMGYIRTPKSQPLVAGDKIRIETRLLDDSGRQVGKLLVESYKVVKDGGSVSLEAVQQ